MMEKLFALVRVSEGLEAAVLHFVALLRHWGRLTRMDWAIDHSLMKLDRELRPTSRELDTSRAATEDGTL